VPSVNWIQFHAETSDWDVELVRDDRSPSRPLGNAVTRTQYRFQIQGPNAAQVIEKLNGGPIADIKFFRTDFINIKGKKVHAGASPARPSRSAVLSSLTCANTNDRLDAR
jgi:vanillate/3-O-methylgallate O-demethylase